jgi:hypothetical protein
MESTVNICGCLYRIQRPEARRKELEAITGRANP